MICLTFKISVCMIKEVFSKLNELVFWMHIQIQKGTYYLPTNHPSTPKSKFFNKYFNKAKHQIKSVISIPFNYSMAPSHNI